MNEVIFERDGEAINPLKNVIQVGLALAWIAMGFALKEWMRDPFFWISYVSIGVLWLAFMVFYPRFRPKFYLKLTDDALLVRASALSELEFKWNSIELIKLEADWVTIKKNTDEKFDIGLAWLDTAQLTEFKLRLKEFADFKKVLINS
jgi:hypothetical protein